MGSKIRTDHEQAGLMRRRLTQFLDDPEASKLIGEMSPTEIRFAIKAAFRTVRKYLEADDGAVN